MFFMVKADYNSTKGTLMFKKSNLIKMIVDPIEDKKKQNLMKAKLDVHLRQVDTVLTEEQFVMYLINVNKKHGLLLGLQTEEDLAKFIAPTLTSYLFLHKQNPLNHIVLKHTHFGQA